MRDLYSGKHTNSNQQPEHELMKRFLEQSAEYLGATYYSRYKVLRDFLPRPEQKSSPAQTNTSLFETQLTNNSLLP